MFKTDRQVFLEAPHVELVDGRTGWGTHNSDLDAGRLPPHLILGAGTAVGFFVFVAWSLVEQLAAPDLSESTRVLSHYLRNFCALSLGMALAGWIIQRKEVELCRLRRWFDQAQDRQFASVDS